MIIKKNNKLFYKQNKKYSIMYNMKQSSIITKKTQMMCKRLARVYALEYRRKFHKQNLMYSLLNNPLHSHFKDKLSLKLNKHILQKNDHIFLYKNTSKTILSKYNAFLHGSSLWALQKQTTARKVFPQTSILWNSNYIEALQHYNNPEFIVDNLKISSKKLWAVGFVKIRKLRQYFGNQLHSRKKFMYWLNILNYKQYNKYINLVYTQKIYKPNIWAIPSFTDTLWSNILVKSGFLLNTSSTHNMVKRRKFLKNGTFLNKSYSFIKPGSIFHKI
jgi:hypothetical protein